MGVFSDLADPLDLSGKGAANQATQLQVDAARQASQEQGRQFDLQQARLEPFLEQAAPAVDLLAKFSGAQGRGQQANAFKDFEESAGQRFLRSRGSDAVNQTLQRLGGGDERVKQALAEEGKNIASQSFQDQLNLLARVGGVAQTTGSQLNQGGQQFATQFGQIRQDEADALRRGSEMQQSINSSLVNQAAEAFGRFGGGNSSGISGANKDLDNLMSNSGMF